MKKSLLLIVTLSILVIHPAGSQGLMSKMKKAVSKEVSGIVGEEKSGSADNPGPEPNCACNDAKFIADLAKYKIDYKELSISTSNDGSILINDRLTARFFILRNGEMEGPYDAGHPKLQGFYQADDIKDNDKDAWVKRYPELITKSGEKYTIKSGGKSYGPFAVINDFAVSTMRDKFAAIVTENIAFSENEAKQLEEQMKNAKSDQEKMEIAMKLSQQMQDQINKNGGPATLQPKMVSNVPGAVYDPALGALARLNGKVKYDEIMLVAPDKIYDLKGNSVMSLSQNSYNVESLFVNTSNTQYAFYNSGSLVFSNNTTMTDLFNPNLVKTDGKVYLTYLYYSPGKNAIMQCAIPY
jgi:hypothetical protein